MPTTLETAQEALLAGRLGEAERLCGEMLTGNPADIGVQSLYTVVLARLGRYGEAERLLKVLVKRDPNNAAHLLNLGCVHMDQRQLQSAVEWFRKARALAPQDVGVNFNLGLTLYQLGELAAAADILPLALKTQPDLLEARVYLARAQLELGRRTAAHSTLQAVKAPEHLSATALNDLGLTYAGLDEPELGERMFQLALLREPDFHEARINLAYLAERSNRVEQCRELLDSVADSHRRDPNYVLVRARLLAREGNTLEALQWVEDAFAVPGLPLSLHSDLLFEQGKLLDRLNRYDEAYLALLEANAQSRDNFRRFHPAEGREDTRVTWLEEAALDVPGTRLPPPSAGGEPDPVFVIGFPRSGTTLLDQLLDAHPALQVLEEKPSIQSVVLELSRKPGGFPKSLDALSDAEWSDMRKVYWQTVAEYLRRRPNTTLVDKFPLNLVRLPVILRLFPRARIVLALRHPCDAVFSCFMQNFRFTESTHGFWSIGGTARIYDQVMREWSRQREKYAPPCMEIRYERMVADFRGEVEKLLDFLGVGWDDSVLNYREHALRRGAINTPSYDQVIKPIYNSAIGRWQNYRRYFESSLPLLTPHIQRLGYDV